MRFLQTGFVFVALTLVSGCAETGLRTLFNPSEGPDEFSITPGKPLEEPTDYATLPTPTPGGANLTDQNPLQDGAAALGGRRPVGTGAIPSGDAAIVRHTSRFGRDASIREELAEADEQFRRRRARLTQIRIVRVDRYFQVYRNQAIDPAAETRRWRRAGVKTPSAPLQ